MSNITAFSNSQIVISCVTHLEETHCSCTMLIHCNRLTVICIYIKNIVPIESRSFFCVLLIYQVILYIQNVEQNNRKTARFSI